MPPDHFEKAMQGIAIRSAENGGPTIKDVLDAIIATNDDAEERHIETVGALNDHCEQYTHMTAAEWQAFVAERNRMLADTKRAPRRMDDPSDSEFGEKRETAFPVDRSLQDIIMGWRFGKWVLGIVFVAVVGWGLPFWADSCASANAERIVQHQDVASPAPQADPNNLIAPGDQ
jgi:hypothetical protein